MHRVWVCPQMVSVFLWVCTCNARLLMLWKYWTMILPKLMRWAVNDYLPKKFGFDSRKCSTVGCKGIAIPKYRTNFFHDAIVRFSAYLYFHIFSYIFQVTNYILVVAIMFFFRKFGAKNHHQDLLPNAVAVWGSRVIGTDEGDGWLKVWW